MGPVVRPAPDGFFVQDNIFKADKDVADFTSSNLIFSSSFSHEVSWTILIKGLKSGAVKEIKGTSSGLNAYNSTWNGNSSGIFFFRKDEICIAELRFMGSELILRDTVVISHPILYDRKEINGVKHNLIDDFEGNGVPIAAASKDAYDRNVTMTMDTFSMQGLKGYRMAGFDLNKNSWSGGITHNTLLEMKTTARVPETSDPDNLYVNLYVYGSGKPNSAIQIKLYEVDSDDDFNKVPSYTYRQDVNDAWIMDIPVTWKGWKLVSKKYSQFTVARDPALGGNGNKIKQPNRITGMGISLLSLPDPGSDTEVIIDYVILTEGGVFVP